MIQSRLNVYYSLMLFVFNVFHIFLDFFSRRFWRPGDHDIALRGPHYIWCNGANDDPLKEVLSGFTNDDQIVFIFRLEIFNNNGFRISEPQVNGNFILRQPFFNQVFFQIIDALLTFLFFFIDAFTIKGNSCITVFQRIHIKHP